METSTEVPPTSQIPRHGDLHGQSPGHRKMEHCLKEQLENNPYEKT